jgi:hypothetical protein
MNIIQRTPKVGIYIILFLGIKGLIAFFLLINSGCYHDNGIGNYCILTQLRIQEEKNIRKGKDIFVDKIIREGKDGFWKEYEKSKKIRDEKRKILAIKSKLFWKPKVDKWWVMIEFREEKIGSMALCNLYEPDASKLCIDFFFLFITIIEASYLF